MAIRFPSLSASRIVGPGAGLGSLIDHVAVCESPSIAATVPTIYSNPKWGKVPVFRAVHAAFFTVGRLFGPWLKGNLKMEVPEIHKNSIFHLRPYFSNFLSNFSLFGTHRRRKRLA